MKSCKIVPELVVKDVLLSVAFYRSLGFHEIARAPKTGVPVWVELAFGDAHLMLQEHAASKAEIAAIVSRPLGGTAILVLRFDAETAEALFNSQPNVNVIMKKRVTDYGTSEMAVVDPDGYIVLIAGQ